MKPWSERNNYERGDDDCDPSYGDIQDGSWIGALVAIACLLGAAAIIVWSLCQGRCF